jgi:hypothetical protein
MNSTASPEILSPRPSRLHRAAPALTLALLAPLTAEVLSGSTRLSFLFVLLPEIMVWGCGALLIRELVRRWRAGGVSLVLLGLALAVAEEWVIQQTSLAPLPFTHIQYGRLWGVNWIWFLFFLAYECVWVVLVPVQVTELIFRKRRGDPWLSRAGLIITSVLFVVGSFIAWFLWTHIARPKTFHVPMYQPPAVQIILGVLMIAALVLAAHSLRRVGSPAPPQATPQATPSRSAPPVWLAFLAALLFGVPWYALMSLIFGGKRLGPFWVPMLVGALWAAMAWTLLHRWTSSRNWSALHRWALCFGATIVVMGCGFLGSGSWSRKDLIFKIVLNVLAIAGFILLAFRLRQSSVHHPSLELD